MFDLHLNSFWGSKNPYKRIYILHTKAKGATQPTVLSLYTPAADHELGHALDSKPYKSSQSTFLIGLLVKLQAVNVGVFWSEAEYTQHTNKDVYSLKDIFTSQLNLKILFTLNVDLHLFFDFLSQNLNKINKLH